MYWIYKSLDMQKFVYRTKLSLLKTSQFLVQIGRVKTMQLHTAFFNRHFYLIIVNNLKEYFMLIFRLVRNIGNK